MDKKIIVKYDESPFNPRHWDNMSELVLFHNRYNLGDKHNFSSPDEFLESYANECLPIMKDFNNLYEKYNYDMRKVHEHLLGIIKRQYIIQNVYMYEHGNISISTSPYSCRWDSGQIGWVLTSKEQARKEYGIKNVTQKIKNKVIEQQNIEVATYSEYASGEVYHVSFIENDEIVDSCGGIFESDLKEFIKSDSPKGWENVTITYE
jgi:hypothetical protein